MKKRRISAAKKRRQQRLIVGWCKVLFFILKYATLVCAMNLLLSKEYKGASTWLFLTVVFFGVDYVRYVYPIKAKKVRKMMIKWLDQNVPGWDKESV